MIMTTTPRAARTPSAHGIDLAAPGGIEQLLEFHRATFGDARMEHDGNGSQEPFDESGDGDRSPGEDSGEDKDLGAKRALAVERKAAKDAKSEAATLRARVQELEDATKSEEQKREDAQKALTAENSTLKASVEQKDLQLARYEVAAAKGLDLNAAKRLQGSTREELEADADDWIRTWGAGAGQGSAQQHKDPGQGARHGAKASSYDQGIQRARARFGGGDNKQ